MHLRAEYTELTLEIFELIHGVFADQGYDDAFEPACDSMWANVNPRGAFNSHHTHPHALWSGVYYVRTPDDCGLLCLTDPRPQAHVITPYFDSRRRSAHTWAEAYYQPGSRPPHRIPRLARPFHPPEHGKRRLRGGRRGA